MASQTSDNGVESISEDELVVVQLLEEIRRLILLPGGVDTPGVINPRRMAAAKLYLDTRDAFEAVERQVEEHVHERPRLLRKLSRRASSIGSAIGSTGGFAGVVAKVTSSPPESPRASGHGSTMTSPRYSSASENVTLNEQVIDRIQEMFRDLGQLLGSAILRELQQRKLTLQSVLHYVRFLPAEFQWTAYSDARREEVAAAYRQPMQQTPLPGFDVGFGTDNTTSKMVTVEAGAALSSRSGEMQSVASVAVLKRHAEFVKHQIRKDVDTVCLFSADGKLSTIFGDDAATIQENVAGKFESLLTNVYSQYLVPPLEAQMDNLIQYSDQWSREMAEANAATSAALAGASGHGSIPLSESIHPYATYYSRPRRFRCKLNIFSEHLHGIDERFATVLLPPVPPGQHVKILVADNTRVGLWWQKSVFSASERDVSTLHNDELRKISSRVESLDGHIYSVLMSSTDLASQFDQSARRYGKSAWASKWIGQRILVNTGRDSLWVEVRITDVDERKCKLQLKPSLENSQILEASPLVQLMQLSEWVNARDLRFIGVPVCPDFRTFMGLQFREILELMQSVVVEISSIFPNGELNQKVSSALWALVEPSIGKGEHIYSRYFRSILQHNVFSNAHERRMLFASIAFMRSRGSSLGRGATLKNMGPISEVGGAASAPSSVTNNGVTTQPGSSLGRQADAALVHAATTPPAPSIASKGAFSPSGRFEASSNTTAFASGSSFSSSGGGSFSNDSQMANEISAFEKLSHHLLEESELVGASIQAHSVAMSRAFVQVLVDKISKIKKRSIEQLRHSSALNLEHVMAEYASAYRLLHVWRICRHELDTVPRQRRPKVFDSSNCTIHFKWVDRTFELMEIELLETIDALGYFVHRTFFHEAVSYILPGVFEQAWLASKPWFSNSRCTYAVQACIFRFEILLEKIASAILCKYERSLGVHEKLHKLASTMLVDVFASMSEAYMSLEISRARLTQWKMDVLYLVCGVHKLLRLLDRTMSTRVPLLKKSTAPLSRVKLICMRLLEHVALRCGSGDVVLDAVKRRMVKKDAQHNGAESKSTYISADVDVTIELDGHINDVYTALDAMPLLSSSVLVESSTDVLWQAHSIFQDVELRKLGEVQLKWGELVYQSRMSSSALLEILKRRHEIGEWAFPVLTDTEKQFRDRLLQFIDGRGDKEDSSSEGRGEESTSIELTAKLPDESDVFVQADTAVPVKYQDSDTQSDGPPSFIVKDLSLSPDLTELAKDERSDREKPENLFESISQEYSTPQGGRPQPMQHAEDNPQRQGSKRLPSLNLDGGNKQDRKSFGSSGEHEPEESIR